MMPYVALTSVIAMMALTPRHGRKDAVLWALAFGVILVFTGLRHRVGMDWNNYSFRLQMISLLDPRMILGNREPGYDLLLWVSGQLGWGLYLPNLLGSTIFLAGLFRYARTTPAPWIALLVAMPYLVIAFSMSGARQSIAIGLLLLATASWGRSSLWVRVAYVAVASLFHISAIAFLILAVRDLRVSVWVRIVLAALLGGAALYVLRDSDAAESYRQLYVAGRNVVESGGALYHVMLNAGPALLYFAFPRYRAILLPNEMHRDLARFAIILIPISFVSSTGASRLSLYTFPVSMYLFAALPLVLDSRASRTLYRLGGAAAFVGLTVFWLTAATNSSAWLPYRNMLTEPERNLELCCRRAVTAGNLG